MTKTVPLNLKEIDTILLSLLLKFGTDKLKSPNHCTEVCFDSDTCIGFGTIKEKDEEKCKWLYKAASNEIKIIQLKQSIKKTS